MITSTKKRLAFSLVVTTAVALATIGAPAKADPKQYDSPFVGVGSDTVQDIMNAASGFTNAKNYTPLQSSAATGQKQIISYDAIGSACISAKVNFATFTRPNGSGAGKKALSRAIDGGKWGTAACGGVQDVSGAVDFARSSAGPTAGDTGTALTYVPFGRDGVSFAYYQKTSSVASPTITSLTRADLQSLFTTGPQVIGGTLLIPCGIQQGSGTRGFWQGVTGASDTQEDAAAVLCNSVVANALSGKAEENDGNALAARGDKIALLGNVTTATTVGAALTGVQTAATAVPVADYTNAEVIIGFSAAAYSAKDEFAAPAAGTQLINMGTVSSSGSTTSINLTAVTLAGSTATFTVAAGAPATGVTVIIAGVGLASAPAGSTASGSYNGLFTATNISATQFSVTLPTAQLPTFTVTATGVTSPAGGTITAGGTSVVKVPSGASTSPGAPIVGTRGSGTTAGVWTSQATFFNDPVFGRNVYTVWPTSTLVGIVADPAAQSLVVGSTSSLCSAVSTISLFGFLSLGANCGTTTTTGSLNSGQS
jgi:hypothetical protein